jgi:CRISPR-associated protein Cmr2
MPRYLMAISLGPVQGFIAAARRTRDFWMGSTILSECAKAVARELMRSEQGPTNPPMFEQLIFPAVEINEVDGYLTPIDFDADNSRLHNKFDVSNVVMAVVVGDKPQVRAFATHLETVAQERWRGIAREAAKHCRGHLRPDWDKQLKEHLIEFYSAWVPLADNYGKARQLVMRLLAGRKACRNFAWWEGKSGVPKSSLDGARESIVRELRPKERRGRLRVKPKEQLDLIGVAKRGLGTRCDSLSVGFARGDRAVCGGGRAIAEARCRCRTVDRDRQAMLRCAQGSRSTASTKGKEPARHRRRSSQVSVAGTVSV